MNLTIDLNGDSESRLKKAATRQGVKPEVYAKQIIEEHLPAVDETHNDQATLELLANWDLEDATNDAGEIAGRQKEVDEFKQAINENRSRTEGPTARKIYP